jgi:hypothetical protein
MTVTIQTLLGEQEVILLPGHGDDDEWWACLDRVPPQLSEGGPTVASGETPQRAADVLAVAIDRFLRVLFAHDND